MRREANAQPGRRRRRAESRGSLWAEEDVAMAVTPVVDMRAEKGGGDAELLLDGCRGVELQAGDCQRALEQMRQAGVRIVSG